jgi:hypothetical protein
MKCVNEKMRNNRSTEWELNVKFEITTIYFLKGVICQLSIKTQYHNKNKIRTQIWISFSQGPPLPSLIPSFAVDYNVKKANGERTDNGRKKMPRWA